MIACCNDGTQPVLFKIERIDIPENDEENARLAKRRFANAEPLVAINISRHVKDRFPWWSISIYIGYKEIKDDRTTESEISGPCEPAPGSGMGRGGEAPAGSAGHKAKELGVSLLTEELYRRLQSLGEFDLKTSSWIATPEAIRSKGGALFCERRYDTVFTFHNGADSYYSVRGFRGYILI